MYGSGRNPVNGLEWPISDERAYNQIRGYYTTETVFHGAKFGEVECWDEGNKRCCSRNVENDITKHTTCQLKPKWWNEYAYGWEDGSIQSLHQQVNLADSFPGYIDYNISLGYWGGFTGGVMAGEHGLYPYFGGGFVSPGGGGSVTFSPHNPTTGWNVGFQVQTIAAGQIGYSFGGKGEPSGPFWELGVGAPGGVSLTGYHVWGPFFGTGKEVGPGSNP